MASPTRRSALWSERAGNGPPLLLLHGIGATHHDFSRVHRSLRESFEVLSVDLPGHGQSPLLDRQPTVAALTGAIEALLDACGIDAPHVLGNSLGGRLALELAARGRARSVVAIAPFGPAPPVERLSQVAVLAGAGALMMGMRPLSAQLSRHWWGRTLVLGGVRAQPWKATQKESAAFAHATGSRGYWRTLLANAADVPLDTVGIRCPVALAQGTADWISGGQTLRYAALIAHATMTWLPFAGHAAQGDTPEPVVALVRSTAAASSSATATADPGRHELSAACPTSGS